MTQMSTHWRTGTCGMTWSTRCAAVCAIRRAPHEGQNPRRLPLKATSLSWPQSPQRRRRKPWARTAAFEEGVELVFDELRQAGAGSVFSLSDEGRSVLLNQAVQRGLFRAVALVVVDWSAIRRPLGLPADGLHAGLPSL